MSPAFVRMRRVSTLCLFVLLGNPAYAAGTAVGTVIENTANITYDLSGTALAIQSNTTSIVVAERINVTTTLQSPQTLVAPNDLNRALLFTVTNTGNGDEAFALAIDSAIGGDDFDPDPAVPAIYFDSNSNGVFDGPDQAYVPGGNEPLLAPDASVNVFIVNDIPGAVSNGQTGRSQLTATSMTGSGPAGTVFAAQGDGGVDAVIGTTTGSAAATGEYLVSDVLISVVKAQLVNDPNGGNQPIPGATITYTITVEVTSAGVATASALRDAIPTFTTFVPGSITLNGGAISDAIDADDGELDSSGAATVVVRLGDLTQADGVQTVVFQVTIDE
tara:strand:- start:1432 stop:2427 length:996 start_codon:yes stop_codon:yes gene_type:complete